MEATASFKLAPKDPLGIWQAVRDWINANRTVTAIRLRVNPKESQDLLDLLVRLESEIQPGTPTSNDKLAELEKQLVKVAQVLLKREWTVVRDEEPVYRLTKYITLGIVLLGLLASAVLVVYQPK